MSENKKDLLVLISVFITGAAVLIVEIIATRILGPYYGNTIFTTSSIIGTILAALSLGYYFGGRLADKYPEHKNFYLIIVISGLLVIITQILSGLVLPFFDTIFSFVVGPIFSSLILFFIPALSLGLLSPFAIKLHKKEGNKMGQQSGEVFFWSTLGSIFGSFLSGFFLIPYFGVSTIVIATGVGLGLWGMYGFLISGSANKKIVAGMIVLLLGLGGASWFFIPKIDAKVLYQKDELYQRIKIANTEWNGRPARFLFQDQNYSAGIYLDSEELAFDYTKYYALYRLVKPEAKRALFIGGGAYSMPKALLKDSPHITIDVAEIEPKLFDLAKQYFNLKDTPRLTNHVEDGRHFLRRTDETYDIVVSDVYSSFISIPAQCTTKEFFDLAKSKLSDGGIFIGNFIGGGYFDRDEQDFTQAFVLSEMKTFKDSFPNSYFFAVNKKDDLTPQNIMFLGINDDKKLDFNSDEIVKNKDPIISGLPQRSIDITKFDLSLYSELTDNYSPVENLVASLIGRWY